jgi:hypothetical protein
LKILAQVWGVANSTLSLRCYALVKYEFIRMPDSTGFGDYTESGLFLSVAGKAATLTRRPYARSWQVVHDYLLQPSRQAPRVNEMVLAT